MRPLNHIEQAFTYSNEVNPLCVVIVLRMRDAPKAAGFRASLDELQRRHVLLQCGVVETRSGYSFRKMDTVEPIPLRTVHRDGPHTWEGVTERELNLRFDASGPLIRTVHVVGGAEESEFVLVLHHSVMDGTSARLLLHELFHLSNGLPLPPPLSQSEQLAHHAFPPEYRGRRLAMKLLPFLARQAWGEMTFARRGAVVPAASSPHNRVMHLCIPQDVSRRLNVLLGREGLSLNAVLNAALLLAVRRRLHATRPDVSWRPAMRAISFTELRPSLVPSPQESVLGCMISMLRVGVDVHPSDTLLDVAHRLRREIFVAGKSGEPYLMAVMAKRITRMALRMGRSRIANSAVSFLGKLDLEPKYGSTQLIDVHAFITNNFVGPELSGFAKILFGRIEMDLTYLSSEITDEMARELLSDITVSLHDLVG